MLMESDYKMESLPVRAANKATRPIPAKIATTRRPIAAKGASRAAAVGEAGIVVRLIAGQTLIGPG